MHHKDMAKIFKALCDENRIAILELLRNGEHCACKLSEKLQIGQSALSYHMKILCQSQLVVSRSVGKWTHYKISQEGCAQAKTLLQELTTVHEMYEDNCGTIENYADKQTCVA